MGIKVGGYVRASVNHEVYGKVVGHDVRGGSQILTVQDASHPDEGDYQAHYHEWEPCNEDGSTIFCDTCGQEYSGKTGEYPCGECGQPQLHDE